MTASAVTQTEEELTLLKITGVAAAAALIISTFGATPAKAALTLAITDQTVGNTDVIHDCTGNNILCAIFTGDTNGNTGQISANLDQTSVFSSTHNVNSAQISAAGSPALPMGQLSLTDLDIESGGPTTLYLYLTNTDQTSPTGAAILNEALSATSTSGHVSVSLQGFENNSNIAFGEGPNSTPIISVSPVANGGAATQAASSTALNFSSPYSLTEVATITFLTAGSLNLNFTGTLAASPVPEPGSVMLFGTVLAGVGFAMRKRFARS